MANLKTVSLLKSKLEGGGARPNLFEVVIPNLPTAAQKSGADSKMNEKFSFLCKAAALPASNIAPIDVPFRGRIFKVAGDRTFDTWTITVINDEGFELRTIFEQWMNGISQLNNATGATEPVQYMQDAWVYQLGRGADLLRYSDSNNGALSALTETSIVPLRTYKFWDIFPTNISQIDLSYDTSDTIEEFTVEFQVQYWTVGTDASEALDQTATTIQ